MKGLKKIALASAVAAASAGAQAELKALDDSAMGELTGQAGLTIDLETKYTIGEFMYKDAGSVYLTNISLGANTNDQAAFGALAGAGSVAGGGYVDNIRIKLDIAGAGATKDAAGNAQAQDNLLSTGFSRVRDLAAFMSNVDASVKGAADTRFADGAAGKGTIDNMRDAVGLDDENAWAGKQGQTDLTINDKQVYDDGDLLIHVSFKDAWQKSGGLTNMLADGSIASTGFDTILGNGLKSVDFNFSIDAIGLADSNFEAGDSIGDAYNTHTGTGFDSDGDASTTVLISDLSINGYLGPVDIHIENNGNGFGIDLNDDSVNDIATGFGEADSKINWNTYVNVTDLDVYLDIAGVLIEDMKINNVRGDVTDLDGNFAFGFAQSKREIYAVRNAAGFDLTKFLTTGGGALIGQNGATTVYDIIQAGGVDGVAINTEFKGDMEIGALKFGDTDESIGSLYWTDIESTTNWTISAHD